MVQIGTPGNRRNRTTTGRADSCTPTIGANKTVSGCDCGDEVVEVFFNRNSTGSDSRTTTVHGLADGDAGKGQKQDECFHKACKTCVRNGMRPRPTFAKASGRVGIKAQTQNPTVSLPLRLIQHGASTRLLCVWMLLYNFFWPPMQEEFLGSN